MARTEQEIIESMGVVPAPLTDSPISEMGLWRAMAAKAIRKFEQILDIQKADIDHFINNKQYGTVQWYIDKAYEFQLDDDLIINDYGTVLYEPIIEENRIITRCAAFESGGIVYLKISKSEDNELTALGDTEKQAFESYMREIKPAGIQLNIISEPGDLIKLSADVHMDGKYSPANIKEAVTNALIDFKESFEYNGILNISDIYANIETLNGMKGVVITDLQWKPFDETEVFQAVERQSLVSGYFNYDYLDIRIINESGNIVETISSL